MEREQESDTTNSSPLSSSNASGSPATTASPTDDRTFVCDRTDGMHQTNGVAATNGLENYHTKASIIEENGNEIDDSSYLALDQLLASLALENDIMERHLSQINNNNDTNAIKFKTQPQTNGVFSFETNARDHYARNGDYQIAKKNGFDENLNDVLANLIEFTENETLPQHQNTNIHTNFYANGHHSVNGTTNNNNNNNHHHQHQPHLNHFNNNYNNNNNHINNNYVTTNGNGNGIHNDHINRAHNYHEPSNNAIKRLTSESENSSSVSPSLSERSNGIVSWSDQVCCNRFIPVLIFFLFFHFFQFYISNILMFCMCFGFCFKSGPSTQRSQPCL